MGVCLNKKCCDGNEKKKVIINVNVNKTDKSNNNIKEKSITLDENLLNQNSKYIINNIHLKKCRYI